MVDDVKQGSLEDEWAARNVPESQMPYPGLRLVVRTSDAPESILPGLRRALRETNPAIALSDVRTLANVLHTSLARQRFTLTLIGGFATAALLLAVLGLYGVIAMSVQARRHELGVRLALGARPAALVRLVLREGMQLAGAGVALGLAGAFLGAGALRALLYGVSERDAGVFAAAAAVVIAVALVASWVPARRATRQDPTEALRVDCLVRSRRRGVVPPWRARHLLSVNAAGSRTPKLTRDGALHVSLCRPLSVRDAAR